MEPQNDEVQKVEELQLPLIIAIENGSGSSSNSKIAHELAMFIKCPLIDENDISQALREVSLTTSNSRATNFPDELAQNLPFEAICQLVSTQLSLKIKVIMKTLLSSPARIVRLDELARSFGARLIIIDRKTGDQQYDDYDIQDVLKLYVDMDSFDANKVVSDISSKLSDTENYQVPKDNLASTTSFKPSLQDDVVVEENESYRKMKQPTNDHVHSLTLFEKPRKDKLVCKSCKEVISSSCYQCVVCDEFILHKSCAESAANVKVLSQNRPPFLKSMKPHYDFKEKHKCSNCEEFSYDCCDCLLQTHLNHGFLPTVLYHSQHQHLLNFVIMPLKYNYQYLCCACGTIQLQNDQHRLSLTSQDDSGEYYCDICDREGDLGQLFYQCEDCDFAIHVKCLPELSQSTTTF
ncbi:uncharacterized protein LOC8278885 [Ricinus communis]|uniref:uncharacterized protein LOC8278885 n=1 Tax=Ricinus communis TaxID=3988 RepID=UPI000D6A0247|nr:uncharacterized protein LOC8278885 [Ricinus communis]|eukprot:XP_025013135.1 uncharacterized protein LOC8278885 [Ricinus communis]